MVLVVTGVDNASVEMIMDLFCLNNKFEKALSYIKAKNKQGRTRYRTDF